MQLRFHGKLGQCILYQSLCIDQLVSISFNAIHIHIFTNNTQISWNHKYLGNITSFGDNTSVHGTASIAREMSAAWLLTVQAFAQEAVWGHNELTKLPLKFNGC